MLSSFSLSELLLCETSVWYPDDCDLEVPPATLLLISLALDNVDGESANEISESLLMDPDSVRR